MARLKDGQRLHSVQLVKVAGGLEIRVWAAGRFNKRLAGKIPLRGNWREDVLALMQGDEEGAPR